LRTAQMGKLLRLIVAYELELHHNVLI
jgi:hypothetical protein